MLSSKRGCSCKRFKIFFSTGDVLFYSQIALSLWCLESFMPGRSEPLLIADFTAAWCGPCQKIGPVFELLATEHKGAASFVKVDIDDVPDAFDGISIPAFHVGTSNFPPKSWRSDQMWCRYFHSMMCIWTVL